MLTLRVLVCILHFCQGRPSRLLTTLSLAGYIAPLSGGQVDGTVAPEQEAVSLEALDIANCGLSDQSMKLLFQALSQSAWTLLSLDVSQNLGRVPASMIQQFMESVGSLRQLNLSSSVTGSFEGELLPLEALERLEFLEELDISNFKVSHKICTHLFRAIRRS